MKSWLKRLGILALVVIALPVLFVLSGYLLPTEVTLELEHRVDAPPEAVYQLITTYDGVVAWWKRANEIMGEDYEVRHLDGPENGTGMHIGFAAPGQAVLEQWTFAEVEPHSTVRIDVDMGIVLLDRTLELAPDGSGTLISWTETGEVSNPLWRIMLRMFKKGAIENRHTVLESAGSVAAETRG